MRIADAKKFPEFQELLKRSDLLRDQEAELYRQYHTLSDAIHAVEIKRNEVDAEIDAFMDKEAG